MAALPFHFIGSGILHFNAFGMRDKLERCVKTIDSQMTEVPPNFFQYLVAAEDHRSEHHCGIDPIGIFRAAYVRLTKGHIQGASTIEQQFVRVVTGDYSRSMARKFKEQILAIALAKRRRKIDIGSAYLAIAYYGYNCEGARGIQQIIGGKNLSVASENQIASVVARLKYPKPLLDSSEWDCKHFSRVNYIFYRLDKHQIRNSVKTLGH